MARVSAVPDVMTFDIDTVGVVVPVTVIPVPPVIEVTAPPPPFAAAVILP